MGDLNTKARQAYQRRAWADAFAALKSADAASPLEVDDVERLVWAAGLTGRDDEMISALERLHQLRVDAGQPLAAVRATFWLCMRLSAIGERGRAGGWLAIGQRLVEQSGLDSVEAGYLKLPNVHRHSAMGEFAAAQKVAGEAAAIGDRFKEPDLSALARTLEARALFAQGQHQAALSLLDEAMVAVTRDELSPQVTGLLYCIAIAGCQQSYALDRAREWTQALSGWCAAQPQLVSFAGTCLIHRSEIMQLKGDWPSALAEVRVVLDRLEGGRNLEGAADASYQEAELHRVRGEFEKAETAYARASELGREPQPGLALLRLAQGKTDAAANASRRVLTGTKDRLQRTRFLPAHIEIMLAVSDLEEAGRADEELAQTAATFPMEILTALANQAHGSVLLSRGDAQEAIEPLRQAQAVWQHVGAPFLIARIRVLVGRAFAALGDDDGAALERDAARKTFTELGAAPDLAALDAVSAPNSGAHGLTARELQVLLLVAAGKTNKAIAKELFLSEKTVDRHVSNIFGKLDVPTRSAATAWAYEHRLL